MIGGMHAILYSNQADAVRAFFRDVLKFPSVDAGRGWLIFAAPPGELAIHPTEKRGYCELYLMCADIQKEVARLEAQGVEFTMPVSKQVWGLLTHLKLPDGELLGLYQPQHPTAIRMSSAPQAAAKKAPARKNRKKKTGTANRKGPKRNHP